MTPTRKAKIKAMAMQTVSPNEQAVALVKLGMTPTRASFVATFDEAQAAAIEKAAEGHKNGVHDRPGSDEFRWAIAICIGYECMSKDEYREWHGVTAPWDEMRQWIIEHGDLRNHDGDVDYMSLILGTYNEYVGAPPMNDGS